MRNVLLRVLKEEDGATALEYAILVVLVAIVFSVGAFLFGNSLSNLFSKTASSVNTVGPGKIGG